jgi:hypothetical protein
MFFSLNMESVVPSTTASFRGKSLSGQALQLSRPVLRHDEGTSCSPEAEKKLFTIVNESVDSFNLAKVAASMFAFVDMRCGGDRWKSCSVSREQPRQPVKGFGQVL